MKRVLIVLIALVVLISCATHKANHLTEFTDKEQTAFDIWKTQYKNVVFRACLSKAYNYSEAYRNFNELDKSTPQDYPFGIYQYRYIDTIVQPIVAKAKVDSTEFYKWYFEGMNEIEKNELNGLPMIKYCLEFYVSEELNSIANQRVLQMDFLWREKK